MTHDFTNKTAGELRILEHQLRGCLKNEVCQPIHEPVTDTLNQIERELKRREPKAIAL